MERLTKPPSNTEIKAHALIQVLEPIKSRLVHNDKNEERHTYNYSTYLEQRKKLMTW